MNLVEYVFPARIHQLQTIDPGEIRLVQLALPEQFEIEGKIFTVRDTMRPGTAFLAKPWGSRTGKLRRRMYTRSNSAWSEPRLLETFINHTHQEQADTSVWWQSEMAFDWFEHNKTVDVRLQLDQSEGVAMVYENTMVCKPANLRLEDDGIWEEMKIVCVAFGTGITPFLSYIRYMAAHNFGRETSMGGAHITLIASARHEGQLMLHEDLLLLEKKFPQSFRYFPVLTRSWPMEWGYLTGRIMRVASPESGTEVIDISSFLTMIPDIANSHLRICGSVSACRQLVMGLEQKGIIPMSTRTESW